MYCYWSCLGVCLHREGDVSYHNNSKLHASIFTKLGLYVKVVTISSWLNFGSPAPLGRGSVAGWKFLAPRYCGQRAVFASLWVLFFISAVCVCFQEYSLRVQSGFVPDQSHYVTKRYSDFAALDTVLRSYGMDFSLPPKKVFGKMDSDFIEERQRGLQVVS